MYQSASKVLFAAALCGSLAACDVSDFIPVDEDPTLPGDELQSELLNLEAEVENLNPTAPADLQSGSAQYNGVMGLEIGETDSDEGGIIYGDLAMNVDFAGADPISGTVNNFYYPGAEESLGGQLTLGTSTLDPNVNPETEAGHQYTVGLAGSINEYAVQGNMTGDFYGAGASHTYGYVEGQACLSGSSCLGIDGGYIAEQ